MMYFVNEDLSDPELLIVEHSKKLITLGPPALYCLHTEKRNIDGTDGKVRLWTYGQKDNKKPNKVVLLVGETGAGKTTLVNTMVNHLLGIKFDDGLWNKITEESEHGIDRTNQAKSRTSTVTIYEVFVEEQPISLTIIDTPGFGHTGGLKRDVEITEYLTSLFSSEDGIHCIDEVCFVMKSSQNRLSAKESYIFHSILSLFGKDMENNIVFIITHSDGLPPTDVINAINIAKIPCRRNEENQPVHFLFNNRQGEKGDEQYEKLYKSAWEQGERSMDRFLGEHNRNTTLKLTLDVLKERKQLETYVSKLEECIKEKQLKINKLNQIQEMFDCKQDRISNIKNTRFTVQRLCKKKIPIENASWWDKNVTTCNVCQVNCHKKGCWLVKNLSYCEVMKDNHCTVCAGKCHYTTHTKENRIYVQDTQNINMTFDDIQKKSEGVNGQPVSESIVDKDEYQRVKEEYDHIMRECEELKSKLDSSERERNIDQEISRYLITAVTSVRTLSKFSLKADCAPILQHLGILIRGLNEAGEDEYLEEMMKLKKAEDDEGNKGALHYIKCLGNTEHL